MPLYEYKCTQCGTKMEIIQKFDDHAPVCGCGHVMKKEISRTTFILNGKGWYKDGYSKDVTTKTTPTFEPIREGYNAVKKTD